MDPNKPDPIDVYEIVPLTDGATGRTITGKAFYCRAGLFYAYLRAAPWYTPPLPGDAIGRSPPVGIVEGNWQINPGSSLVLQANQTFRCSVSPWPAKSHAFQITSLGGGIVQFQAWSDGLMVNQFTITGADDPYTLAVFSEELDGSASLYT